MRFSSQKYLDVIKPFVINDFTITGEKRGVTVSSDTYYEIELFNPDLGSISVLLYQIVSSTIRMILFYKETGKKIAYIEFPYDHNQIKKLELYL